MNTIRKEKAKRTQSIAVADLLESVKSVSQEKCIQRHAQKLPENFQHKEYYDAVVFNNVENDDCALELTQSLSEQGKAAVSSCKILVWDIKWKPLDDPNKYCTGCQTHKEESDQEDKCYRFEHEGKVMIFQCGIAFLTEGFCENDWSLLKEQTFFNAKFYSNFVPVLTFYNQLPTVLRSMTCRRMDDEFYAFFLEKLSCRTHLECTLRKERFLWIYENILSKRSLNIHESVFDDTTDSGFSSSKSKYTETSTEYGDDCDRDHLYSASDGIYIL